MTLDFVFILCSLFGSSEPPQEILTIRNEAWGCRYQAGQNRVYRRDGDLFVSSFRSVPAAIVKRIRDAALNAPREPAGLVLTKIENRIVQEREEILRRSLGVNWVGGKNWLEETELIQSVQGKIDELTEVGRLKGLVLEELTNDNEGYYSTSYTELSISLPGDPPLVAKAYSDPRYGLFPWTISNGKEQWKIYSWEFVRLVRLLLDSSSPNWGVLQFETIWNSDRFFDLDFLGRLDRDLDDLLSRASVQRIEGFKRIPGRFRIASVGPLRVEENKPEGFWLILKPMENSTVDSWELRVGPEKMDWHAFLAQYEEISSLIATRPWIADWKSRGEERSVWVDLSNEDFYPWPLSQEQILREWEHAGFPGKPKYWLKMNRSGKVRGGVGDSIIAIFNAESDRTLIPAASRGVGEHPLDQIPRAWRTEGYNWDGETRRFGVMDAAGNLSMFVLPE